MLNIFILLLALLVAVPAKAAIDQWKPNQADGFYIDSYDTVTYAHIGKSTGGNNRLWFRIGNSGCKGYKEDLIPLDIASINGTRVKITGQCMGNDDMSIAVKTDKGHEFVIDTFKKSKYVTITFSNGFQASYSAKGFSRAWNILINEQAAI